MNIDDLRNYGADVDGGLNRCMDNESFYLRLVGTVHDDTHFDELAAALDAGDLKVAFEVAHALKGVLANLGITPLLKPVQEITELLRAETQMDYAPLMDQIATEKARFDALA